MEWLFTATPGGVKDNMTEQFAISSAPTLCGNDGISPVIPLFYMAALAVPPIRMQNGLPGRMISICPINVVFYHYLL